LGAGDAFGGKSKRDEIYTELLLKVYGMLHYDGLNLGRREFTYGLEYLKNSSKETSFPFLAANVVDKATKKPIFEPYVIKTFGEKSTLGVKHSGIKIGIFGVAATDSGRSMSIEDKEKVEFLDPITTAESIVGELSRKCDMIIGMGNMEMQMARKLTSEVKGINLFLISGNMRRLYKPEVVQGTDTILLKCAARGKQAGKLTLTFDVKGHKVKTHSGELVSIDDKFPKDRTIEGMIRDAKRRGDEITRKKNAERTSSKKTTEAKNLPNFRPRYVGSQSCAKCHKDIYDRWSKTRHANAMATLVKMGKDKDPGCFRCHTTGYADSQGYLNQQDTPQLANVQCEACHGPASMHLDNSRIRLRKPTLRVCEVCHTTARSRPLDWERDKKLVH